MELVGDNCSAVAEGTEPILTGESAVAQLGLDTASIPVCFAALVQLSGQCITLWLTAFCSCAYERNMCRARVERYPGRLDFTAQYSFSPRSSAPVCHYHGTTIGLRYMYIYILDLVEY